MNLRDINLEKVTLLFSIVFIILILIAKLLLVFYLPIGFNEGVYGLNAQGIAQDKTIYKDLFDHKSPFIYYSLLIVISIIGDVNFAPHLLAYVFDVLLAVSVLFIARYYLKTSKAWIAMAIYLVFSGVSAIYLDTEIPATLFGLWAVFLYLRAKEFNPFLYFFSGILLAISVWFKQTGLIFFIAIFVYEIYQAYKTNSWKKRIKNILLILLGVLVISLPLLTLFLYNVGYSFIFDVIIFNMLFDGPTSRIVTFGKFLELSTSIIGIMLVSLFFDSKKNKEDVTFIKFLVVMILVSLAASPEIFQNHFHQIIPIVILMFMMITDTFNLQLKKFVYILVIIIILSTSLADLEDLARNQRSEVYANTFKATDYLSENIPIGAKMFSDDPIYFYLLKKPNWYKTPGFAPSYVSVFDTSDFCEFSNNIDYLVLTHRQNYLPDETLNCTLGKFTLVKRFDNSGESFVELWKKSEETN